MVITDEAKKALLKLARDSIAYRFTGIPPAKPTYPELQEKRGVFVTPVSYTHLTLPTIYSV